MTTPAGDPTSQENTENGTVYYYDTTAASKAVMTSAVRLQKALGLLNYGDSSSESLGVRMNAKSMPSLFVTAAGVTAAASAVSAVGTLAIAGNGAVSAGTGLASLFGGGGSGATLETVEFTVHNDTGAPIILYNYDNDGLDTTTGLRPLMPGGAETIVAVSNGSDGFVAGSSEIRLTFLVGGGSIQQDGQPVEFMPITAQVKYSYTNESVWAPNFHLDGGTTTFEDSRQGLSAAYFMANADTAILDFTVAAYTVEKATAALDIVFMPGSAALS